jgi:hypothetical protein
LALREEEGKALMTDEFKFPFEKLEVWQLAVGAAFMTLVIAGSTCPPSLRLGVSRRVNRTPTGLHRRCGMFIRTKDDSGNITLEVMAGGFGQQPVEI